MTNHTGPATRSRPVVTMRWDELTTAKRLAVARTANAMAAGSLTLERLSAFLDARHDRGDVNVSPPTLAKLLETLDTLRDVIAVHNIATLEELWQHDTSGPCEGLADHVDTVLSDAGDPMRSRDDAYVVALAAQILAMAIATEQNDLAEEVA